jgi:hypothetical protein
MNENKFVAKFKEIIAKIREALKRLKAAFRKKFMKTRVITYTREVYDICCKIFKLVNQNPPSGTNDPDEWVSQKEERNQEAEELYNQLKATKMGAEQYAKTESTYGLSVSEIMECIEIFEKYISNEEKKIDEWQRKNIQDENKKASFIKGHNLNIVGCRIGIQTLNYMLTIGITISAKEQEEALKRHEEKLKKQQQAASESVSTIWEELLICD